MLFNYRRTQENKKFTFDFLFLIAKNTKMLYILKKRNEKGNHFQFSLHL